jgi:hypothetical protein
MQVPASVRVEAIPTSPDLATSATSLLAKRAREQYAMPVTLTDEQAKNWASTLRTMANTLDPPATTPTPAPIPPATNYPNFQLIYDEQFTKDCPEGQFLTTYGDRFFVYPNGWKDTSKKGNYNPGIISVNAGVMNMRMRTINGVPQVSAPEPKINGSTADRNQLYGRYEARFRADATDGYKLAWLLWPKSGVWPRDGEIDFPEGDLVSSIGAFMHRQNGTSGGDQDGYKSAAKFPDWHTAVIEWKHNSCSFILDGTVIGHSTSRVPNTPMHWVLQCETELNSTYPAASAVANVQVDYVRIWKYIP